MSASKYYERCRIEFFWLTSKILKLEFAFHLRNALQSCPKKVFNFGHSYRSIMNSYLWPLSFGLCFFFNGVYLVFTLKGGGTKKFFQVFYSYSYFRYRVKRGEHFDVSTPYAASRSIASSGFEFAFHLRNALQNWQKKFSTLVILIGLYEFILKVFGFWVLGFAFSLMVYI